MALPIWGYYMKKCYEDEELDVSKGRFPAPENQEINMNCGKNEENSTTTGEDEVDQIDF